ncbi:Eco57I restriction-modification methylase domain-containing protein [Clostridium sp. DL1XJH146]
MYNDFEIALDEIDILLKQPIHTTFKIVGIKNILKKYNFDGNKKLSEIYLNAKENKKKNGIVYTPIEIATFMVEEIITAVDIVKNPFIKVLDPACGCGNILIPVFNHLRKIFMENLLDINSNNKMDLHVEEINEHILRNNLYGFDIDAIPLKILRVDLFLLTGEIINDNLLLGDFLLDDYEKKFDIIVGNPPYIGHKSVDKEYHNSLKKEYKNIFKGKSDILYCFFQKAIQILSKGGKLCFITSRYFMESQSGEGLRTILKEYCSIYKIVDFYGIRPFKNTGIDPVILFIENKMDSTNAIQILKPKKIDKIGRKAFYESLFYGNKEDIKSFYINKNLLNNKRWILRDEAEREIIRKIEEKSFTTLGNICKSYQGIITGCDKAFIVTKEEIEMYNLEKEVLKPWIKSSDINKFGVNTSNKYIIYSDKIKDIDEFPNCINYIKKQKIKLIERRECKRGVRQWYELQWGRKEEIFDKSKMIFPYKSNSNRFALDKGKCFSADVYALELIDNVPFSYDYLLFLLNSKVYEYYFMSFAKKLGDNYFEYYPNNLLKLCIPSMDKIDISNFNEELIYEFFNLEDKEIDIINSYFE